MKTKTNTKTFTKINALLVIILFLFTMTILFAVRSFAIASDQLEVQASLITDFTSDSESIYFIELKNNTEYPFYGPINTQFTIPSGTTFTWVESWNDLYCNWSSNEVLCQNENTNIQPNSSKILRLKFWVNSNVNSEEGIGFCNIIEQKKECKTFDLPVLSKERPNLILEQAEVSPHNNNSEAFVEYKVVNSPEAGIFFGEVGFFTVLPDNMNITWVEADYRMNCEWEYSNVFCTSKDSQEINTSNPFKIKVKYWISDQAEPSFANQAFIFTGVEDEILDGNEIESTINVN
ncbi:MAG: hypothetical protein ACRCXZ_05590 [Patescibacteria group bacterium]